MTCFCLSFLSGKKLFPLDEYNFFFCTAVLGYLPWQPSFALNYWMVEQVRKCNLFVRDYAGLQNLQFDG